MTDALSDPATVDPDDGFETDEQFCICGYPLDADKQCTRPAGPLFPERTTIWAKSEVPKTEPPR